jgi:hypothetical protein
VGRGSYVRDERKETHTRRHETMEGQDEAEAHKSQVVREGQPPHDHKTNSEELQESITDRVDKTKGQGDIGTASIKYETSKAMVKEPMGDISVDNKNEGRQDANPTLERPDKAARVIDTQSEEVGVKHVVGTENVKNDYVQDNDYPALIAPTSRSWNDLTGESTSKKRARTDAIPWTARSRSRRRIRRPPNSQ